MSGPLSGVRVLDLTTMFSGPGATMLLADQGAEVIKVESPGGDVMRQYGTIHNGMSAAFLSANRGKRSLSVDIKTPEGLQIVKKLAATSDVLVQNFRPGAIERMGLGEEVVREIKPDIVFVSISGFGEKGPYAHQRVYDPVIQALCGLADIQADQETGEPRMVRTIIPDKTTALTAAQAITAALFARARTGEGQHVRLAMLDAMVAYLWPEAISGLSFVDMERDPAQGQVATDLIYRTQDHFITAGAVTDSEWAGMCRALKREELIEDPRFATAKARSSTSAERRAIVAEELKTWSSKEILDRFDREHVPCAPVLTRTEMLDDPQVIENRLIETIETEEFGPVRQPRPAARFDKTPPETHVTAPRLGEDNGTILTELGYSRAEIDALGSGKVLTASGT